MSSLKDKMYYYEVTPPANAWGKINSTLDELKTTGRLSTKLYNLEAAPPAQVWEKIHTALEAEPVKKPPAARPLYPLFRYAAAAAFFIGIIVLGAIKFSGKKTGEKGVAKENIVLPKEAESLPVTHTSAGDMSTAITQQQRDDAALEASKKTFAKMDMSEHNKRELRQALMMTPVNLISSGNPEKNYPEVCFPDELRAILANKPMPTINTADRYIILMTPDGNIIRMSKKWADLLCCVSGEDEDEVCQDQLKKWRQQIAGSSLAPSPANFMDILSMVESLRDN
jgi:hypothetical protein